MLTVDGDEASTVRTAIPIQIQTGGTYYFGGDYSKNITNHPVLLCMFQVAAVQDIFIFSQ